MIEQLKTFLESLRSNPRVPNFDEAATKQAIILPLLHLLGWNTYNVEEVTPEFSVESRRVDYSLRLNHTNEVFLEVKKTGEDLDKYQEQLLDYSFRQGVELAILTNGMTWWFYLPTKKGDWKARKFYTIDVIQQESHDVAQKFIDLLSKANVQTGKALQHAESIYKGKLKKKSIEETLPEAWNRLVSEPDSLLVDLLSETTEKLCGFKPEIDEAKRFLKHHESKLVLLPKEDITTVPPRIGMVTVSPPRGGTHITRVRGAIPQNEYRLPILKALIEKGGNSTQQQVYEIIEKKMGHSFNKLDLQILRDGYTKRWQKNVAFARFRMSREGLLKPDSPRGIWEISEKGRKYFENNS